jgi:hypothetical protein
MGRERLAPLESGALGTPAVTSSSGAVLAHDRLLPLAAPLAGLFPEKGLRRGSTVVIGRGTSPGMTSLALALLHGPCAGGSWCAVVGAPDIGLVAASQLGVDLGRLAVIPSPGPKWAMVTAALLEGFDVVLLRAVGPVNHSDARKLEARARERGSVLAVMGDGWPGSAAVRLGIVNGRWCGLEDGCGHLWGREVEVVASGRGAASRQQRARIWFGQPEIRQPKTGQLEGGQLEGGQLEGGRLEDGQPGIGLVAKLELVTGEQAGVPSGIGIAG